MACAYIDAARRSPNGSGLLDVDGAARRGPRTGGHGSGRETVGVPVVSFASSQLAVSLSDRGAPARQLRACEDSGACVRRAMPDAAALVLVVLIATTCRCHPVLPGWPRAGDRRPFQRGGSVCVRERVNLARC
jgi:hypothetical protein